jgi:hypothetical protein
MKRLRRIGMILWGILLLAGWLGYLPYLLGMPGIHGLALLYNALMPLAAILILGTIHGVPFFGSALGGLVLLSLYPKWRPLAYASVRILLRSALALLMVLIALLPSFILQYQPYAHRAIAPWRSVYRAIYVSPLDNNYGDLMLLRCYGLGLCRQVYRTETNISSVEEALIDFNSETNQAALYLEGRWVYVRSPRIPPCKENLRAWDEYGKCDFTPLQEL